MKIRIQFPAWNQIIPVFTVTAFLIFGWTLYRMLQKLPSWLLYLRPNEIAANFSYAVLLNFVESLLIVSIFIGLSAILPQKYFKDAFIAQGTLLSVLVVSYLIYLSNIVGQSKANIFPWDTFKIAPVILGIILFVSYLIPKITILRKILEDFADRATVFLYIIVPVSAVGGLIIIFNNLF